MTTEMTPEQVEEYRQKFESAKKVERQAYGDYQTAYRAWWDTVTALKKAESAYRLVQHGMARMAE